MEQLESQIGRSEERENFFGFKLEAASKASESENSRLKEENSKLKAQYRDQDRRARLLRQGWCCERQMIGLWSRKFSGWPICFPISPK